MNESNDYLVKDSQDGYFYVSAARCTEISKRIENIVEDAKQGKNSNDDAWLRQVAFNWILTTEKQPFLDRVQSLARLLVSICTSCQRNFKECQCWNDE